MQHSVYAAIVKDLDDLNHRRIDVRVGVSRALPTTSATSGVNVSVPVFRPEVDTLNIRSDSRVRQTDTQTLIHSINIAF